MDCYFDPERHEYTVNDKVVPSVTEICSMLTSKKYAINQSLVDYAAARGSRVHELTELYDMGLLPSEIEAEVLSYIKAYAQFVRDFKPEYLHTELQMFCEDFAGTCDRVAVIGGEPRIIDFKTTSSMDVASQISLCVQLSGYWKLYIENYEEPIRRYCGMGVQLKNNGTYEIYDINEIETKYCFDGLEVFNELLRLNKLIKGDWEWKHH